MLRDITIGQYYLADSPIHKMDPRFKLLATVVYVVILFLINDLLTYALSIAAIGTIMLLSKVPMKFMFKGVRGIVVIIVITALINMFATRGETVYFQIGIFHLTKEGIIFALRMVVRLVLLILASSVLTLTTTPIQLTDAIEYILKPFRKIGVPAHEIAMMMTIALRFIPTLLDETDKIIKAQTARGADFDTGGLLQKAKSLIPILVPLFVSAFRRADELAMAMEARCYRGGDHRTRMNEMVFGRYDYMGMAATAVFAAVMILLIFVF